MALFGGAYFNRQWKAFAFPLLMLFISDFILQQTVFKPYGSGILYGGWYWVYGAFALMTLAGRWLLKNVTIKSFILSSLICPGYSLDSNRHWHLVWLPILISLRDKMGGVIRSAQATLASGALMILFLFVGK